MRIRHFVDTGLSNSAYLVISEAAHAAALIDPLRGADQYLNVATPGEGQHHPRPGDAPA